MAPNAINIVSDVFLATAPSAKIQPVTFPLDELEHSCPVEWWYFVGHLQVQGGVERYAFEMTAARLRPAGLAPLDSCYLSVIDLQTKEYISADRQSPYAYDDSTGHLVLSYAPPLGQPGAWRIEGWDAAPAPVRYRLDAAFEVEGRQRAVALSLDDKIGKPVLLHGTKGVLSVFGHDLGYYSRTRLAISGGIKIDGRSLLVSGDGWMDHEYGAADLPNSLWTFLAIQLDSGDDLCVYRVDQRDTGVLGIPAAYRITNAAAKALSPVTLTPYGNPWGPWGYPLHHHVKISPTFGPTYDLRVEPEFDDQRRVPTGKTALPYVTFWEGAAKVLDAANGNRVGRAFLEVAGYE